MVILSNLKDIIVDTDNKIGRIRLGKEIVSQRNLIISILMSRGYYIKKNLVMVSIHHEIFYSA